MDYRGNGLNSQSFGRHEQVVKPQLPNFEHFVRTAGHPDLAHRGSARPEPAFISPQTGQSSLPTPPATSGQQQGWLAGDVRRGSSNDQHCAIVDDGEDLLGEFHRRASFVQQSSTRPQPRPMRSYSSVQSTLNGNVSTALRSHRVISEEDIPGKGICYVYEDGSLCPKEVNGDVVNPKWGTTKAGKPRKRLGQACNACRDKKIRCDPQAGNAKCSQCSRSNRECRFSNGSRQGHRSPKFRTSTDSPLTTNIHSPNEYVFCRKSSITPTEVSTPTDVINYTTTRSSDAMQGVLSPTMSDRDVDGAPTPSKRQRMGPSDTERTFERPRVPLRQDSVLENAQRLGFAADLDPAQHNVFLTKEYVNCFLEFVNGPTFEIFPPHDFLNWVTTSRNKSLHDCLMLYAMMAWGTIHSDHAARIAHREMFKQIVYSKMEQLELQYCLQTVHTLLFLSFAEFADVQHQKGFSLFVRCVGAISFLQLNIESSATDAVVAYDFSSAMYVECRRRTYWAAFCTDVFSGLSTGNPRMLHNKDIFLRLPCTRDLYEADRIPLLPMVDQEDVIPNSLATQVTLDLGDMAWLLQIASVCSEVQLNAWRSQNNFRVGNVHTPDQEIRNRLERRLEHWQKSYHDSIIIKEGRQSAVRRNTGDRNGFGSQSPRYTGLDALYHYAHMELDRRVYRKCLSEKGSIALAKNATYHALHALKFAQQIQQRGGQETRDYYFVSRGPLMGYCLHSAIDIVTAAGRTADILEPESKMMTLMYSALELLENLARWWASSRMQYMQVKERIQLVFNSAQTAATQRKQYFCCSDPMIRTIDTDFDLIYGMDRKQYLREAYELKVLHDVDVYNVIVKERELSSPVIR